MSDGEGFDAGPFSMLAVSALENHVQTVQLGDQKFAALQRSDGATITQLMIFCRGLLGYDDQQRLCLRNMSGKFDVVEPGDWLVMLSRTAYVIMRLNASESLFSLMPNVALCTPEDRLGRIAQAHVKDVGEGGLTSGVCVECYQVYPCPTYVWATKDRDPLATWDPIDDEPTEEGVVDLVSVTCTNSPTCQCGCDEEGQNG